MEKVRPYDLHYKDSDGVEWLATAVYKELVWQQYHIALNNTEAGNKKTAQLLHRFEEKESGFVRHYARSMEPLPGGDVKIVGDGWRLYKRNHLESLFGYTLKCELEDYDWVPEYMAQFGLFKYVPNVGYLIPQDSPSSRRRPYRLFYSKRL